MDEQVQMSTEQPGVVLSEQQAPESGGATKWLPFGFTWTIAWRWSIIVMPLLCFLSFLGLAFGIYAGFSAAHYHPLILTTWVLIDLLLWIVVIVHTIVDVLVVRQWHHGDWGDAFNGYIISLTMINGLSLLFGAGLLVTPGAYGGSSFFLLVSLGVLTFMDIWVMNHIKEKKAAAATL